MQFGKEEERKSPSDIYLMIFKYLIKLGKDPEVLCEKIGVTYSRFQTGEIFVTREISEAIWKEAILLSDDSDFGLHFGEGMLHHASGHILVTLTQNCPTVESALECIAKYHSIVHEKEEQILIEKNEKQLSFPMNHWELDKEIQLYPVSCFFTFLTFLVNHLAQKAVYPHAVHFESDRPEDLSEYKRIFQAPLFFQAQRNEVIFLRQDLQMPVPLANAEFYQVVENHIKTLIKKRFHNNSWKDRVATMLAETIYREEISLVTIAHKLAVTGRMLQKKLKEEGTTFSRVWDKVRLEIAQFYLGEKEESIADIALLLGFSDQSAFTKAFKQWTSITPRKFRTDALKHSHSYN